MFISQATVLFVYMEGQDLYYIYGVVVVGVLILRGINLQALDSRLFRIHAIDVFIINFERAQRKYFSRLCGVDTFMPTSGVLKCT